MTLLSFNLLCVSRSSRNNGISVGLILAQTYCRIGGGSETKGIQGRLSLFFRAMALRKLLHSFLSATELCSSYVTSNRYLRHNAAADRTLLVEKLKSGWP